MLHLALHVVMEEKPEGCRYLRRKSRYARPGNARDFWRETSILR